MRVPPAPSASSTLERLGSSISTARAELNRHTRRVSTLPLLTTLAVLAWNASLADAAILGDFGDAPHGAIAYPTTGVIGQFPTCLGGATGFVAHIAGHTEVHFGPGVDFESDGNGGACAWPPYDNDECAGPVDAGLIAPDAYTIVGGTVVTCSGQPGRPIGMPCTTATWGAGGIDIDVTNLWPATMYVNVLIDWNQDGAWGGLSSCTFGPAQEHVLVDFPVPAGYSGPLSALTPPGFLIGPNQGHVWTRFTIGEVPVGAAWNGAHTFDLGETEDYLLRVGPVAAGVPGPGAGAGLGLELEPARPNPARAGSTIAFTLDAGAPVRLTVTDASGRAVAVLVDGEQSAGRHQVIWNGKAADGRALPQGFYFIHARSGAQVRTQKVAFLH